MKTGASLKHFAPNCRYRIFVKDYGFLPSAKNMGKNIGKNISQNLIGKYSQKLLDHAKNSTTNSLKTSLQSYFYKDSKYLNV